jgi:hypothetical protein
VTPTSGSDQIRSDLRSFDWWMRDADGRLAIAMWPNPALSVWLAAKLLGWTGLLPAVGDDTLRDIGRGALLVWSLDELIRGASPFRRVLGAVVLSSQLYAVLA